MLNINVSDLIYTGSVHIMDPKMLTNIAKKHLVKDYFIVFNKELSKEFVKKITSSKIRLVTSIDNFEFIRDESNMSFSVASRTLYNNNLCMFTTISYKDLISIVSYIINNDDINLHCDFAYNHNMVFKDSNDKNISNQKFKSESDHIYYQTYNTLSAPLRLEISSICNNNITLQVQHVDIIQTSVDYTAAFNNYELMSNYVIKASKQFHDPIQVKTNISEVSTLMMPTSDCNDFPVANIVKMFNSISLQHNKSINISRTYIQSQDLDKYVNNQRPTCYVRTEENSNAPFKNINAEQNVYIIFIGEEFNENFVLDNISIYKYGGIMFNFYITSSTETIDEIIDIITQKTINFFKNTIIKYISIADFFNSPHYDPTNYSLSITNVSGNVIINNASYQMLEDAVEIIKYKPNTKMIYKTKTSCEMSMMCDKSLFLEHGFQNLYINKGIITKESFVNNYATRVHIGYMNNSIIINIKKTFSYELYALHIALVLFSMTHFNKKVEFVKTITSNDVIDIKELAKFSITYPKENLKQLQKEDPELFGKRFDGSKKTYSNLCQKPQQRPVIINKATYDKYYNPDTLESSVAALDNQTYNDKVIYLMCVNEEYPIINFHHIPNQKCIIRCTTQFSNKTQYEYCAKTMNLRNFKASLAKNENQMIIRFNSLLTVGRKCMLPQELVYSFTDYVLSSFETLSTESIVTKCKQLFNAQPFIMERNEAKEEYTILTTDVNFNENTILLITHATRPNVYFYPVNLSNYNIWLNLKNYKMFTNTIMEDNNLKSKAFNIFFDYIVKVVPDVRDYNYYQLKTSLSEYFEDLVNLYKIKYIVSNTDKEIVGLLTKDNMVYTTPRYIYGNDLAVELNSEKLSNVINRVENGLYKLPTLESLSDLSDYITTYYKDQTSQKLVMINIMDYDLLVTPTDIPKYHYERDIVTIDYESMKKLIKEYKRKLIVKQVQSQNQTNKNNLNVANTNNNEDDDYVYFDVITQFVFLCYYDNLTINYDNIKTIMEKYNVFTTNESSLKYINATNNTKISWTTSKISDKVLTHFFKYYESNNMYIFIKLITTLIKMEYEYPANATDSLHSKFISV